MGLARWRQTPPYPLGAVVLQEPTLAIGLPFTRPALDSCKRAVRLHVPRSGFVAKVLLQNFVAQAADELRAGHGKQGFHAAVQIPRHKVRAAHINLLVASVVEVIDAAVLEKAAENTLHPDGFADPGNTRPQSAHAANNHVDLHARLRGAIERANQSHVLDSVHLENHVTIAVLLVALDFALDQPFDALAQA